MTKIAFIIRANKGRSEYYHGNVKPFVDLSLGLYNINFNSILFLHEDEKHLYNKIYNVTNGNVPIIYYNDKNFCDIIINKMPDYMVIDDDIKYMKMTLYRLPDNIKKVVYVQYLFGVNTNKKIKRKKSLKLFIGSFIPWKYIINNYKKLLGKFDYIISNSQTCRYILTQFYDLVVSGVVYPPVGVDMRPIIESESNINKSGILIFVGNMANDYFLRNLSKEIVNIKNSIKEPVRLFASEDNSLKLFRDMGIEIYNKLSVEELVKIISSSSVTYVPTAYELFGYVGAESILCATPVILDTYHPFLELFPIWTRAVIISNPECSISNLYMHMKNDNIDIKYASNAIEKFYSPEESAKSLLMSLNTNK